jgi:hypothetical protein
MKDQVEVVFVGDRGMVTSQNLEDLRSSGHGYIVGHNRRRSGAAAKRSTTSNCDWSLDRMPGRDCRQREVDTSEDTGSGGLITGA